MRTTPDSVTADGGRNGRCGMLGGRAAAVENFDSVALAGQFNSQKPAHQAGTQNDNGGRLEFHASYCGQQEDKTGLCRYWKLPTPA